MITNEGQSADSLYVGSARSDITPEKGTLLLGLINCQRAAEQFLDPLHATALVIQSGARKLLIVSLDVTFITEPFIHEIRRFTVEHFGFEWEAVMVHATQNHGAPAIGYTIFSEHFPLSEAFEWLRKYDPRYIAFVMERIKLAIRQAHDTLCPVLIGVASGTEGRVAYNRRMIMRDGSIAMPRGFMKNGLYLEGPMDPEVGVMCFQEHNRVVSMILNFTCHPVHLLWAEGTVSADWPGQWSDRMAERYPACTPLVLNGACGNINPWNPYDPDYEEEDAARMGKMLAAETDNIIKDMVFKSDAILDYKIKTIKIPRRVPGDEALREARAYLEQNPVPSLSDSDKGIIDHDWVMAAQVIDVNNQLLSNPDYDYEIQVLRIGEAVYVGLPGELFVEGGLQIKLRSPAPFTYIVHATGYAGYIPFKEAIERGGHEAYFTNWSKLVPDAFDIIVDESVNLIHEVLLRV